MSLLNSAVARRFWFPPPQVLISYPELKNETYVGQTEDVPSRLAMHNRGRVRSTSHGFPWRVIHTEECPSRAEAMAREKWFKSKSGRMEIRKILDNMKVKL